MVVTYKLYDVLGLDFGASEDDIKKAYKSIAKRYHPDKLVGKSPEEREEGLRIFQEANKAHEILTNPEKRHIYDESGDESLDPTTRPNQRIRIFSNELIVFLKEIIRLPFVNVSTICKLATQKTDIKMNTLSGFKTIYNKFGIQHFFTGGWGILLSKIFETYIGYVFARGANRYLGIRNGFSYWVANTLGAIAVYPINMALTCVRAELLEGNKISVFGVLKNIYHSPLGFKGLYSGLIPWCLSHIVYSITSQIIEETLDRIENWLRVSDDLEDIDTQPEKVTMIQQLKIIGWFIFIKMIRPITLIGLVAPFEYFALNYQVSALKGGNEITKRGLKVLLDKKKLCGAYSSFFSDFLLGTLFK